MTAQQNLCGANTFCFLFLLFLSASIRSKNMEEPVKACMERGLNVESEI